MSEGLPESDGEGKGERERQSESRKTAKLKSSIGMPRKCDDEEILTLTREGQIRKSLEVKKPSRSKMRKT